LRLFAAICFFEVFAIFCGYFVFSLSFQNLMAKPDLVRHINQARALRLLKEQGTLSRAELARFLNLNRSTLTFVTGALLRRKLIREAGEPFVTQATGRPGTGLKLNPDGAYFLGAEIGAERVHLVLIDLEGSIRHRQTAKLRSSEPRDVSSVLVHLVQSVWRNELRNSTRLQGIGVAVSALVDAQGVVRIAPTLGWDRVDLKGILQPQLDVPVFVENDAKGAALAELSFGLRVGQSDICLLFLDVGVGAGVIVDRKIFRGSNGLAGEIGHLTLDPAKNRRDERMGFLENQLGRDGLLAAYRRVGGEAQNLAALVRDLKKENPLAKKTVAAWGEWLTLAIRNLADLFNPRLVVLAGALSELFPYVEPDVKRRLSERHFPTVEDLEITVSAFGRDSSALGGAALVYARVFSVPNVDFLEDLEKIG
jgi:predicted NBD/HSP70 family sugar kinase